MTNSDSDSLRHSVDASNRDETTVPRIGDRYRWVMVLIAFVLTGLCFGGVALVAVFLKPLSQEFGWQRGEVAMAYTVATVSTAFAGVVFGRLSDLYGARIFAIIGATTITGCLFVMAQITALWQLYVLYAVFGALGFGAISVPMTAAVTNWFHVNRGLAVGLSTAGGAIGQGLVPFIASTIVTDSGWREAYFDLGLVYFLVALPLALLVRNPPETAVTEVGTSPSAAGEDSAPISPREAIAWVGTAVIFCCICMSVPIIHVPPLVSDIGFSGEQSASVLTVIMFAGAAGRVVIGRVADLIGPLNAYISASLGQTVLVFWFVQAGSLVSLYTLAALFGMCFGGVMTGFILTIRSLVPMRIAGTAMALVVLFGWAGMGTGAYFGGLLFDVTGTYTASFGAAAAAGAINIAILTALFLRIRRVSRAALPA